LLEPIDRISEILFGLIMVLAFTGSFSVAESGREEVRSMLLGAVGCNLAWGIIDAVMYLMACLAEQGRRILTLRSVRTAADPGEACRVIAEAIPPAVAAVTRPAEFESIRQRLLRLAEPPSRPRLQKDDWLGAAAVFLLVFLSTFPVVVPFILMHDAQRALRASNGIAVVMLFLTGYGFGRYAGYRPWAVGISMVLLGGLLVGLTILLGG
jgi:hypothetical protein